MRAIRPLTASQRRRSAETARRDETTRKALQGHIRAPQGKGKTARERLPWSRSQAPDRGRSCRSGAHDRREQRPLGAIERGNSARLATRHKADGASVLACAFVSVAASLRRGDKVGGVWSGLAAPADSRAEPQRKSSKEVRTQARKEKAREGSTLRGVILLFCDMQVKKVVRRDFKKV